MRREITGKAHTFTDDNGRADSTVGVKGYGGTSTKRESSSGQWEVCRRLYIRRVVGSGGTSSALDTTGGSHTIGILT